MFITISSCPASPASHITAPSLSLEMWNVEMWSELPANQLLMSRNKHKKSMCQIDGVLLCWLPASPSIPSAPCVIVCPQHPGALARTYKSSSPSHTETQAGTVRHCEAHGSLIRKLKGKKTRAEQNHWKRVRFSLKYSITICMDSVVQCGY